MSQGRGLKKCLRTYKKLYICCLRTHETYKTYVHTHPKENSISLNKAILILI